jgi:tetratricopeptide (TPR) repeat protein
MKTIRADCVHNDATEANAGDPSLPILGADPRDYLRAARRATRRLTKPSLKNLISRTCFYWIPDRSRLLLAKAEALLVEQDPDGALSLFKAAGSVDAELNIAALIVARRYRRSGAAKSARIRADRCVHALHIAGKECLERGNPGLAISLLLRAATALPFTMRPNSKAPGVVLCDLATAFQDVNEFKLASHIYQDALSSCPAQDKTHWLQRSVILSNLGVMRMIEGRFDEASRLLFESKDLTVQCDGAPASGLIAILINAAHSERTRGNLHSAKRLLHGARKTAVRAGETATPNYVLALIHLADLDLEQANERMALRRCREARGIAQSLGSIRLEAQAWSMEGECFAKTKRLEAARRSFLRTYDLLANRPNDDADERIEVRQLLADVERQMSHFDQAWKRTEEALAIGNEKYGREWVGHADTLKIRARIAYDRADYHLSRTIRESALQMLVGKTPLDHPKRLVLEGELAESLAAVGQKAPALDRLFRSIKNEARLIARLVDRRNSLFEVGSLRMTRQHLELYMVILSQIRRPSAKAVRNLFRSILLFRGLAAAVWRQSAVSGSTVAAPDEKPVDTHDAALAVTETYLLNGRRHRLLMTDSSAVMAMANLGEAGPLEEAFRQWVAEEAAHISPELKTLSDRIVAAMDVKHRLVWLPDHYLAMHPIASLPLGDGQILADRAIITQPRDAYALRRAPGMPGSARPLLVGLSRFAKATRLEQLPGVAEEIASLTELFALADPVVITEDDATLPTVIKEIANRPRMIHLATHGLVSAHGPTNGNLRAGLAKTAHRDPLAGTALVLATKPGGSAQDLLTARDIYSLDLRGVKLVVVAACDSGVAASDASEGVLGLQAALHAAGVETVVTTLWPLYDVPTLSLVKRMYLEIIGGRSPVEALRLAQLATRDVWPAKANWGGWIVSGPV